jgi:hypothetical protein
VVFSSAPRATGTEAARGVANVRGCEILIGRNPLCEPHIVRFGIGAEPAVRAEELSAELSVALYVLGLEARALGGEAVGPAQNGELPPNGPAARASLVGV